MSRDIKLALQEHKQKVLDELKIAESQLLGVFLYGSQNYGLSTEDSDVDTIAIVLPNEYDLYFSRPLTKELHLENGEHCVVKDIREILNEFKKQNVNFLEILVTDY
ncbi:MAG: nucleotidyltransferase domain-containing protein [Lachnospiraceae bacterium]|nr:nucleotidyltransferase domain-containing protein [Lachnospiraceae bacterium]